MLQCVSVCCTVVYEYLDVIANHACSYTGVCVLQCAAVCGSVLREDLYLIAYHTQGCIRTVNICIFLQHTATHCDDATPCNSLQQPRHDTPAWQNISCACFAHTFDCYHSVIYVYIDIWLATCNTCNILQRVQHTAIYCNTEYMLCVFPTCLQNVNILTC